MSGQIDLFDEAPARAQAPEPARVELTREQMLEHRWWGNRCPACGMPAGEPCKGQGQRTLHGMRSRFSAPGQYLLVTDDEWGACTKPPLDRQVNDP